MRKLKIIEHISLDGVIQALRRRRRFPLQRLDRALSDPRWPGGNHRRAWRELRSAAWPPHLRYLVGLLAKGAEQSDGGPPQCGNQIYRYPPSGKS